MRAINFARNSTTTCTAKVFPIAAIRRWWAIRLSFVTTVVVITCYVPSFHWSYGVRRREVVAGLWIRRLSDDDGCNYFHLESFRKWKNRRVEGKFGGGELLVYHVVPPCELPLPYPIC